MRQPTQFKVLNKQSTFSISPVPLAPDSLMTETLHLFCWNRRVTLQSDKWVTFQACMHLPFVHLVYCGSDRYLHFYKNQGQGKWKRLRFAFKNRIHTHKPWTLTFLLSLSKILVLKISRQGTAWLRVSCPVNCCTILPNVLYSSNYFEISILPFHPKYTRSLQNKKLNLLIQLLLIWEMCKKKISETQR